MFGKRSGPAAGNGAQAQPAPAARPAAVSPTPGAMQPRTETPASPPVIAEGGRQPIPSAGLGAPLVPAPTPGRRPSSGGNSLPSPPIAPTATDSRHTESYYETKGMVFGALIGAIDLAQLAKLDADSAREEIRDIVNEIVAIKAIVMSISEQEERWTTSAMMCSVMVRSNRCWLATTLPISW